MKNIELTVSINASPEKVWKTLWNEHSYKEWISPYAEGSYPEHYNFRQGDLVNFSDSNGNGLYALVTVNDPNRQMSFEYLGEMKNGKNHPFEKDQTRDVNYTENYLLRTYDGGVDLDVEMVVPESDAECVLEKFPLALQKLKELAEKE